MSALTRVNQQRRGASGASTPVLYPPSGGPGSGFPPRPQSAGPSGYGAGPPGASGSSPSPFAPSPFRPASAGSQYSESPYGGGMSSGPGAAGYAHDLESHNDDLLSGLLGKVDTLKNLTIGIGKEVRDGNLELSGMNDSFGSTSNILGGTFKRMKKMASRQGGGWCYFMLFMLLVMWIFILVWWFRR